IDGQQRLTTTSLLLLAAVKAVKDGKMQINDERLINLVESTILRADFGYHPSKLKLLSIDQDRQAYERLFTYDESQFVSDSKITRNFKHFYELLTATPEPFTFDELYNVVDRLQVISIDIDDKDDPQLIFESLNSTGLALEEADKIRNYLLMSLSAEEQERYFKDYWQKIQKATDDAPTMFLRDYITISDGLLRPVRIGDLYFHWKRHMTDRCLDRKEELASLLDYSRYYHMISSAEVHMSREGNWVKSESLSKKMRQLRNLDTDVINVFLISFLKYAAEKELPEDEIYKVLDMVECYLARRIVCQMSSNSLTQTFCILHRDILRSFAEYEVAGQPLDKTYSDVMAYHILRRDGNFAIPRDTAFIEGIATRNVYQMPKAPQMFFFERLENFNHKEFIDVVGDMIAGRATIEHIMPQGLTTQWMEELGEDYEAIHERYLHTFANLTLTGVNSELSNNSFAEKKAGKIIDGQHINGYQGSIYRLTQELMAHETWAEHDLKARGKRIEAKLMALYPLPTTTFKPLPKPEDEVSLEDETFNPTHRWLKGYRLFGRQYDTTVWADMFVEVVKTLMQRDPDGVYALADADWYLHISADPKDKRYAKIADNCWLWIQTRNSVKLSVLRHFFSELDILASELTFVLWPLKNEENQIPIP
ncbi:MAG: DUF262 domain-containing protein, partial [Muribaculum sp.]|nr:DUF262 domain-containing protein [Muribaculum sp.]